MEITTVGIDLAKSVFALSCADARGKAVLRRQLRRGQVLEFMAKLKPCVVGMEACGGAHYWARAIGALGHAVRLMSPALVRPYRSRPDKHDRNDADAICEAVRRPQMRYVAAKSIAQQDLLALHRVRAQLMKQRIALSNQLRALLHERGVVARLGAAGLRQALRDALADEHNEVSGALGELLRELSGRLREFEQRIAALDRRLECAAQDDERCQRLMQVPGAGPLTASALVAMVGNAREFKSGRELSAYLGLTPRQHSSGGKTVMLGISKHGDRYLRTLLIHGARSVLYRKRIHAHPRAAWAARIMAARAPNVAAVALANHNARVLWALLTRGSNYRPAPHPPYRQRSLTVNSHLWLLRVNTI
ncbi:MAG: IS110 family transposase [Candidatus Binatus sp.]